MNVTESWSYCLKHWNDDRRKEKRKISSNGRTLKKFRQINEPAEQLRQIKAKGKEKFVKSTPTPLEPHHEWSHGPLPETLERR